MRWFPRGFQACAMRCSSQRGNHWRSSSSSFCFFLKGGGPLGDVGSRCHMVSSCGHVKEYIVMVVKLNRLDFDKVVREICGVSMGPPYLWMHKILRRILARHLQFGRKHEREGSQDGSVCFNLCQNKKKTNKTWVYVMDVCYLWMSTWLRVKCHVLGCASKVPAMAWTTLLW